VSPVLLLPLLCTGTAATAAVFLLLLLLPSVLPQLQDDHVI